MLCCLSKKPDEVAVLCWRCLQDHICAHCICNDVRGGCAIGIHQLEVAAGLRNGVWFCVRMALEPDAGVCLRASALCKLDAAFQQPYCNGYALKALQVSRIEDFVSPLSLQLRCTSFAAARSRRHVAASHITVQKRLLNFAGAHIRAVWASAFCQQSCSHASGAHNRRPADVSYLGWQCLLSQR